LPRIRWYKQGLAPEEIANEIGHLSLAQVHAALAFYHANLAEIETAITADASEAAHIERFHTP
jgi:uncharacterized protein (DUF433 family)